MRVVICPGIHDRSLTQAFIEGIWGQADGLKLDQLSPLVFPAERHPAYSGLHILRFVHECLSGSDPDAYLNQSIVLIGFSAGVVGAIGAAHSWQGLGGKVQAVIAIDGWGVPLAGNFPIHRLSHDHFTYWSSAILGAGKDSFYADPGVAHLDLWQSPQTAKGWWISPEALQVPTITDAASFLTALLRRYSQLSSVIV